MGGVGGGWQPVLRMEGFLAEDRHGHVGVGCRSSDLDGDCAALGIVVEAAGPAQGDGVLVKEKTGWGKSRRVPIPQVNSSKKKDTNYKH